MNPFLPENGQGRLPSRGDQERAIQCSEECGMGRSQSVLLCFDGGNEKLAPNWKSKSQKKPRVGNSPPIGKGRSSYSSSSTYWDAGTLGKQHCGTQELSLRTPLAEFHLWKWYDTSSKIQAASTVDRALQCFNVHFRSL